MKYLRISSLIIIFIVLVFCSGCNPEQKLVGNIDEISDNASVSFVVKDLSPNPTGPIFITGPDNHLPSIKSIDTYDEYRALYPDGELYDENYFLNNGLIEYQGCASFNHLYHEFIKLEYQDHVLTLFVEERGPESYVIHIDNLKIYHYLLEYQKPGQIDDVVLNFQTVKIRDKYSLSYEEEVAVLTERMGLKNYILADVVIFLSVDFNDQESCFETLKNKYHLDEFGTVTENVPHIMVFVLELNDIDEEVLDLLTEILQEDDVASVYIHLHNYHLEGGIVNWCFPS